MYSNINTFKGIEMTVSTASLTFNSATEEVEQSIRKKHIAKYTPFLALGKDGYSQYNNGRESMNAFQLTVRLSPSALWTIGLMEPLLDPSTNISVIRGKSLTKTESRKLIVGYKELHAKRIVTRVKREYYMINPFYIVPIPAHRDAIVASWDALPKS